MFRSRSIGEFYQGEHHGHMSRRDQTRINGVHEILNGLQASSIHRYVEVELEMGCTDDFEQIPVTTLITGLGQVGLENQVGAAPQVYDTAYVYDAVA